MLKKVALSSVFQDVEPEHSSILDTSLLGAVLALLSMGLIMVSSASMDVSNSTFGNPFWILTKQVIFIAAGLFMMLVMLTLPVERLHQFSWQSLMFAIALLVLVLIVGQEINGSTRWIPLGFFNLQASELGKILVVIYMASYLTRHLDEVRTSWSGFFKPLAVFGLVAFLLLLEPDFGSVVVLSVATMGMIFMAGARLHQFIFMVFLVGVFITLLVWIEPYRMARLTAYMDPWADAYGSGYQLTQALIAFGRGGWLGEGLGNSIQKLFYLPEAHTDFVYAVLAEELGMLVALAVIAGFVFISWRSMQVAFRAEAKGLRFHSFLAYGLALLFASQCLINLGVSSGLLPTKGLALPLISYGGSSLIVNCMAFGILLRIDYERRLAKVVEEPAIAGRKRTRKQTRRGTGGAYD
ncbi:cell division protein FtsW [Endozoicomonas sp. (ex Bugula neritina AB1)]|nr:cell division protein FtsW [Endozoicomonas sp. (ex Bugula neritina AB1)]